MQKKDIEQEIKNIVAVEGAELIEFSMFFPQGKKTLRCLVDCIGGGITVDLCAKINKKICSFLEETNILGEDFSVETNSPGLDRKLKNSSDFQRIKKREVSLWLNESVIDKTYLEGKVLEVKEGSLVIDCKGKELEISFDKIKVGKEIIKI